VKDRPDPPAGARNAVLVILDSCRFDTVMAARPRNLARLGPIERRFSYATWTSPSHFNLLMGLLPHPSPTQVFASQHYRSDLARMGHRLGLSDVGLTAMLPRLWLPDFLRSLGFITRALVSLPVLNPNTPLNTGFDSYELLVRHNDLRAAVSRLRFSDTRPTFTLINTGETHYPYATPDEPESEWPRIHGVNGVFKRLSAGRPLHASAAPRFFDQDRLDTLRRRQVRAVSWVDTVLEELFQQVPTGTWIGVTSDHGELFGEGGYFGHGPIMHEKVMEVPLVEGVI